MIKKFDLSDVHNLARLENKYWCFMGDGDGPGSEGGSVDDADSRDSGVGPGNTAGLSDQDFSGYGGPDFDGGRAGGPADSSIGTGAELDVSENSGYPSKKLREPKEYNLSTMELMSDPLRIFSKLPSYMQDPDTMSMLSKTNLGMLVDAGKMANETNDQRLRDEVQKQIDTGEFADYYTDPAVMNALEEAGFQSFGTGYRGNFEARTGPTNQSVFRDQYDPSTMLGSDPSSQRGVNIAMFNQFALDNPGLTAQQALTAYNNEMGPNSVNLVSPAELGMLGYSSNRAIGPAVAANEAQRVEGAKQGFGLMVQAATTGPISVASKLFGPDEGLAGSVLNAIADTPVGETISDVYNSFANSQVGQVVSDAYNSLPEWGLPESVFNQEPTIGPATSELLSDPAFMEIGPPTSFFDSLTKEDIGRATDPDIPGVTLLGPSRQYPNLSTTPEPEPESNFTRLPQPRDTSPPTNSRISDNHYQRLVGIYGPERARELFTQLEEA